MKISVPTLASERIGVFGVGGQGRRAVAWYMTMALGGGLCIAATGGCNEPRYLGRTAASWATDLGSSNDYKRRQGCEALGAMGEKAAPVASAVAERLHDVNEGVRDFCQVALSRMGHHAARSIEPLLESADPKVRFHAAAALLGIDPQHHEAGVTLVKVLTGVGNAELAQRAQGVAVKVGEPLVPLLLPQLQDRYVPVRLQIIETLGNMEQRAGPKAENALAALISDTHVAVRRAALKAVARTGDRTRVEALLRPILDDPDSELAVAAALLMKYIGARPAVSGNEGAPEQGGAGSAEGADATAKEKGSD